VVPRLLSFGRWRGKERRGEERRGEIARSIPRGEVKEEEEIRKRRRR
jgi:hypothetical protein